jgi:hypothetical protein
MVSDAQLEATSTKLESRIASVDLDAAVRHQMVRTQVGIPPVAGYWESAFEAPSIHKVS